MVRALAYEPLINISANGRPTPGLASSWKYIGHGSSVFELHLRKHVKFSDGAPVTASAVKQYLKYVQRAGGPAVGQLNIKSIEVPDSHTVLIRLRKPNPILPQLLSVESPWGAIASPKAVKNPSKLSSATYGAGPYLLDPSKSVVGDHYVYKPNPKYYNRSDVQYKSVEVKVISNTNSMLQALKSGEIDVAEGDASTAAGAKAAGFDVLSEPFGNAGLMILDREGHSSKQLGNIKVRRAMNFAVDRTAITDGLFGRYARPTSEKFNIDAYVPSMRNYYQYDPHKAKALLADAGYASGFSVKVLTPPKAVGARGEPMARAIAKYLRKVGIKLDITVPSTEADYLTGIKSGKYPIIQAYSEGSQKWLTYGYLYPDGAFFNPFGSETPRMRKLATNVITNPDDAEEIFSKMSREATTKAYYVPISLYDNIWYTNGNVHGVKWTYKRGYPLPTEWHP